jgi:hypothetical protein
MPGCFGLGPIDRLSIQEWNATLAINLTGIFFAHRRLGDK